MVSVYVQVYSITSTWLNGIISVSVIQFQCPSSVSDIRQDLEISRKKFDSSIGHFSHTFNCLPIIHTQDGCMSLNHPSPVIFHRELSVLPQTKLLTFGQNEARCQYPQFYRKCQYYQLFEQCFNIIPFGNPKEH